MTVEWSDGGTAGGAVSCDGGVGVIVIVLVVAMWWWGDHGGSDHAGFIRFVKT